MFKTSLPEGDPRFGASPFGVVLRRCTPRFAAGYCWRITKPLTPV
ncbi:hypothetical protein [Eisenibacter elegans]|nr:hypothetical protein [Eisenibacter elegans]